MRIEYFPMAVDLVAGGALVGGTGGGGVGGGSFLHILLMM
jgi:hypothetical protein